MAKCNCNGQMCTCRIIAGDGITITGSGAGNDPLVIEAEGGGGGASGWSAGDLKMVATSGTPAGWLNCNGQAVSRVSFADLFAAIGTLYGAGDGSTTFNVPDYRDRTFVGVSGSKALGSAAGAETTTLVADQLPPHTHSIAHNHGTFNTASGGAHKHKLQTTDLGKDEAATNINSLSRGQSGGTDTSAPVESTGAHTHQIDVPNFAGLSGTGPGTSDPVPVMQPYRAVRVLIKT